MFRILVVLVMTSISGFIGEVTAQEYVAITQSLLNKLDSSSDSFPFYIRGGGVLTEKKWRNRPTEYHFRYDDSSFVQLPLSSSYKIGGVYGWDVIESELIKLRGSAGRGADFAAAIKAYNGGLVGGTNFKTLDDPEITGELKATLPIIIYHALQLPERVSMAIPILKKGTSHRLYLTRNLAASLLAHCFLITFPHASPRSRDLPQYHFMPIFDNPNDGDSKQQIRKEKIKSVLEYFRLIGYGDKMDNSIISYERRYIPDQQNWGGSREQLCKVNVEPRGGIETAEGMLQVDFANKYVGGGVLRNGITQEEIRFLLSPELIVSLLFTEVLGDDEVLVITGSRQTCSNTGFAQAFRFRRLTNPPTITKDDLGRETTQVVAMDALKFDRPLDWGQYEKGKVDRELHKSFVAFVHGRFVTPVATGNWGGGVFNGDRELKFFIQWMAASEVDRPLIVYYTFGDDSLSREIEEMYQFLSTRRVTVGRLYETLVKYRGGGSLSVFEFVKKQLQ